jgi:hypothetical protein
VRDKRRHPGHKEAEVQQNVEGYGDQPHDQHGPRVVKCPLEPTHLISPLSSLVLQVHNNIANGEAALEKRLCWGTHFEEFTIQGLWRTSQNPVRGDSVAKPTTPVQYSRRFALTSVEEPLLLYGEAGESRA